MALFEDHLYNGSYPYLTLEEFLARCPVASDASVDDEEVINAVQDASLILFYLTGRQFNGSTNTTVRPDPSCDSCPPNSLNLGLWPVTEIVAVREEGVDMDPDDYHIDEYKYIVKNNGEPFPHNGNQWAETGDVTYDTATYGHVFEVTVTHGLTPPPLLKRATAALACSLYADSVHDSDSCALPERVTSVTRAGISMEITDFTSLLTQGSTGIYAVDLAVKVLNPSKLQSPSFVWTPDLRRSARRWV